MPSAARLRLVYLAYYGNVGAFMPFFPAYLAGLGFSGKEIGGIQLLPSLLAPVVAPAWATWADRHAGPGRALRRATTVAALAALALPFVRTPAQVAAVVLAMALGDRAVVPLLDAVTLERCRTGGGTAYARIRLFGSIGFVLLSSAVGLLLAARGSRPADPLVPWLVVGLVAGYALAAQGTGGAGPAGARPALEDVRDLLASRPLQFLFGACTLHWIACAPYHVFFGVFVKDLGLPADVAGLGMAVGVVAEIGVLALFPLLQRRFRLRTLFGAAFLGSALRWALLARLSGAAPIVALQLMHGLTFGLYWACTTAAMAAFVPPRLRATGQALYSAIVFGLGNAIGSGLSGLGYDRLRAVGPLYTRAAVLELCLAAVVLAGALPLRRPAARGAGA
jgi:PPP family 3-phenylpropionic acid transporter